MNETLAVFTEQLGTVSETFIRRHVDDLMPGRTVVVARRSFHPAGGHWEARCPVLFLDRWQLALPVRLARRAGMDETDLRDAAIKRFLRQHNVGIVLGEYLDQFLDFVPILDRAGIPYVVQGHGIDLSAALCKPGMAERYLAYRTGRAVLTRCEFHRRRLIGLGLEPAQIHVNPGGVDIPKAVPKRPPGSQKRFLAVGRMVPKKGPFYLLEALRIAVRHDPAITLDYVGGGELLSAARQFVDAAMLRDRVRLHGTTSEAIKQSLLGECGVFIQHSVTDPETGDEEGLPAAIQEAMANGLAIVSTMHSGITEAVEEGISGYVVPEADCGAMADAMIRVAGDAALCLRLGAGGRRKAERDYSWLAERGRLLSYLAVAETKILRSYP